MKKYFSLLALIGMFCAMNAQTVSETVTMFGKDQLNGFSININDATSDIVEGAMVEKFENQMGLKGKKNKGFYTYTSQGFEPFGDAKYDIYFTTQEGGKKNNKFTQLILVVSTGNLNCITMNSDPRTARNIMTFLQNVNIDVESYKTKLRIEELDKQKQTLEKERQNLDKNQAKVKEKMTKTNEEMKNATKKVDDLNNELTKLQEKYTSSHDPETKAQITKTAKEVQSLQKSQTNMRKSLLNMNNEIQKIDKKIEDNVRMIEKVQAERKAISK